MYHSQLSIVILHISLAIAYRVEKLNLQCKEIALQAGGGESNAKSMQTSMSVFHLKWVQEKKVGYFLMVHPKEGLVENNGELI